MKDKDGSAVGSVVWINRSAIFVRYYLYGNAFRKCDIYTAKTFTPKQSYEKDESDTALLHPQVLSSANENR